MQLWIVYLTSCFLLFLITFNMGIISPQYNGICSQYRNYKENVHFYIATIFIMILCASKKVTAVSIDEWVYRRRFTAYAMTSFGDMLENCGGEYINGILTWISAHIFKTDQGIFIVFGVLTVLFYMLAIRKYSRDCRYAVLLLMVMGVINTSFNITQQSLACAILLYFCNYIYERKFWKYLLVVIVCTLIHKVSIVALLFYFFSGKGKAQNTKKIVIALTVIIVIVYSNIPRLAASFPFLEPYVLTTINGHEGVRFITIIINIIPAICAVLCSLRKIIDEEDKITELCGNMCYMHAGIYLASMYDRYIARLAMFTLPFCVIFFSRSTHLFTERSERIFKIMTILLYFIELYLRMRGYQYEFNFSF